MSVVDALGWILEVVDAVVTTRETYHGSRNTPDKLDRQLDEARALTGKEGDEALSGFCETSSRLSEKRPQDSHLFHRWGKALWWRAANASGSKADTLYQQADRQFARALAITPNDGSIYADRAEAMRWRAALHPDEQGRRLLIEVCEHSERRIGIYFSGPHDARLFGIWGLALWWLAAREKGSEARRLYEEADERFRRGYALDRDQTEIAIDRADALFRSSALHGIGKQREILRCVCQQCEELAGKSAGGARMLEIWGNALLWLGSISKREEGEPLFAMADEKFARVLAIDPGRPLAEARRLRTMACRAVRLRGDARRQLLARVCEESARLHGACPQDPELLEIWGTALYSIAKAANGADADRQLEEAAEKFSRGLSIKPADEGLTGWLAMALAARARLTSGEDARTSLTRAIELLEPIFQNNPDNYVTLNEWAVLLSLRARLMPGEETMQLLSDARQRFEAATRNGGDLHPFLCGWGALLWTQSKLVNGAESARLLDEAKTKLMEAETSDPGSAAYELACISSQAGDVEACRRWLEAGVEPGTWISRDMMDRQEEFAGLRECDWFRRLLARQSD